MSAPRNDSAVCKNECIFQITSGVFRILILRVPSVNRIFLLRLLTADAISLFLNITNAIAPVAPVLNKPLDIIMNVITAYLQLCLLVLTINSVKVTPAMKYDTIRWIFILLNRKQKSIHISNIK